MISLVVRLTVFSLVFVELYSGFGIINHQTKWYFSCSKNQTELVYAFDGNVYPCQSSHLVHRFTPMEIDFTFFCRHTSRLLWFIVDLYSFDSPHNPNYAHDLLVSIELNQQVIIRELKQEQRLLKNSSIMVNAFYIRFEEIFRIQMETIKLEIKIRRKNDLSRCYFNFADEQTWSEWISTGCYSDRSQPFETSSNYCEFQLPSVHRQEYLDDDSSNTQDIHVQLAIEQQDPSSTVVSSLSTTTIEMDPAYGYFWLAMWIVTILFFIILTFLCILLHRQRYQ